MVSRPESVEAIARYKVSYRKGMSSSNGKITDTTLITPTITDRSQTRYVSWMTNSCGNTANEAQISTRGSHTLVHTSPLTLRRFCTKCKPRFTTSILMEEGCRKAVRLVGVWVLLAGVEGDLGMRGGHPSCGEKRVSHLMDRQFAVSK